MQIETRSDRLIKRCEAPKTIFHDTDFSSPGLPLSRPPVALLGVCFDNVTLGQALERIEQMIASRRPHYVVTANVDFAVQAQRDVELRRVLLDAHLVICDGMPLVWASRLLGNPLPERVAGADLTPLLLERAAENKHRVFLLGATPQANEQAVANIRTQFPEIQIAGHYSPPFRPLVEMDDNDLIRRIRAARPDILLVSFGCPKAEKWIAMHYQSLGVPVTIGVGATIDFLAGRIRRAPLWMQRSGVEWFYRLWHEPRRLLQRYAKDLCVFAWVMMAQWFRMRRFRRPAAGQNQLRPGMAETTWRRINVPERLDEATVRANARLWKQAQQRHCLLDLAAVRFLDSTGMALLMRLHLQLRRAGRRLVLLAPSTAALKALRLMRWEGLFTIAHDEIEARQLIEAGDKDETAVIVQGATRVLAWRGEITTRNAAKVGDLTERRVQSLSVRAKRLYIDLSDVDFIDSAAVRLMLHAKREAERHGASLHFSGAQADVLNVVRLAQAEDLLLEGVA